MSLEDTFSVFFQAILDGHLAAMHKEELKQMLASLV